MNTFPSLSAINTRLAELGDPGAGRGRKACGRDVEKSSMSVIGDSNAQTELEAREARRLARMHVEVRVFRAGEEQAMADTDALYWDRIPWNERAAFTWQLSLDAFSLAYPGVIYEPRLSRSVARVRRG